MVVKNSGLSMKGVFAVRRVIMFGPLFAQIVQIRRISELGHLGHVLVVRGYARDTTRNFEETDSTGGTSMIVMC
jgi:hypothetical protein